MMAVRKKTVPRAPISIALIREVAKALRRMFPKIQKLHLVGSRIRHAYARDLDFVAVVRDLRDMPGRNVTLKIGNLTVNLFASLPDEVETHILEFGLGADIMRWKRAAKRKGFKLNRYGLWRKGVKVSGKMAEIAALIGMPLKPFLVDTLRNPL